MQRKQGNTLQALAVVDEFIDTNAALLPSVVAPAAGQAKLKAQIIQLTGRVSTQGTGKRTASAMVLRQRELKKALIDEHMEAIRRVAAADLPHTPELKKLTVVNRNPRFQDLLSDADTMAAAAMPFTEIFVAGGLAPDFIANLRAAAAELANAINTRVATRAATGGATKSLKILDAAARRHLKVLDVLIKKDLKNHLEVLNEWSLIRKPRKVPAASTPASPATPPVAASTPTTEVPPAAA